jgi:metal-responsive CopG/Arc/MetJ family transcriptional regulator
MDGTTKFDVKLPIPLLKSFDKAVTAETGMRNGRASKIREMMRDYVAKRGA